MEVATFEKMILEKGETPIHLIMARGRQVKWFVCKYKRSESEFSLLVYDMKGRCYITPKTYTEIDNDTIYNIYYFDEERILVNGVFFYIEPLCNLNFPKES